MPITRWPGTPRYPECKTSVWLGAVAHPVSEACTGHSLAFACPVALVGVNHACGLHVAATRKRYAERSQRIAFDETLISQKLEAELATFQHGGHDPSVTVAVQHTDLTWDACCAWCSSIRLPSRAPDLLAGGYAVPAAGKQACRIVSVPCIAEPERERDTQGEGKGGDPVLRPAERKISIVGSNARDSRLPAGLPVDTCSDVQMRLQSDLLLLRLVFNDLCSTLEKQLFCEEPTAIPMAGY